MPFLRLVFLAVSPIAFFATSAEAASATYRITLTKGTEALVAETLTSLTGEDAASIEHKSRFTVIGGCATDSAHAPATIDGVGRSGQLVKIQSESVDGAGAAVKVTLENNELSGVVATKAGSCEAQTPAMLHWDASASFTLAVGKSNSLTVGAYTVVVTLLATRPDRRPGFSI